MLYMFYNAIIGALFAWCDDYVYYDMAHKKLKKHSFILFNYLKQKLINNKTIKIGYKIRYNNNDYDVKSLIQHEKKLFIVTYFDIIPLENVVVLPTTDRRIDVIKDLLK